MLPDVVLETNIGPSSLSVLPPGIGFRYVYDMSVYVHANVHLFHMNNMYSVCGAIDMR